MPTPPWRRADAANSTGKPIISAPDEPSDSEGATGNSTDTVVRSSKEDRNANASVDNVLPTSTRRAALPSTPPGQRKEDRRRRKRASMSRHKQRSIRRRKEFVHPVQEGAAADHSDGAGIGTGGANTSSGNHSDVIGIVGAGNHQVVWTSSADHSDGAGTGTVTAGANTSVAVGPVNHRVEWTPSAEHSDAAGTGTVTAAANTSLAVGPGNHRVGVDVGRAGPGDLRQRAIYSDHINCSDQFHYSTLGDRNLSYPLLFASARMNVTDFLERLRGPRIIFVGDSLNRNMWESLVCILRHGVRNKKNVYEKSGKNQFKTRGFYSFKFRDYNCSVDFIRSTFLVKETVRESPNGTVLDEKLRLDELDATTPAYQTADIVVVNTGHWWTHPKTSKGSVYSVMWESLVCILRHGVRNKKNVYEKSGKNQFKTRGFYSFKFRDYNCSVDFIRSTFLVKETVRESPNGTVLDEKLRLDELDATTPAYQTADIVVVNTGHWWTHPKTSKGSVYSATLPPELLRLNYYQEGYRVHHSLEVMEAYRKALTTWAKWVDKNIDPTRTQIVFRGLSLTHFKGGQWNSGGRCHRETEPIFSQTYLTEYPERMRILEKVMSRMKTPVIYLNISRLTDYRKDGHPSVYRVRYDTEEERMAAGAAKQGWRHRGPAGGPGTWAGLAIRGR
uniref:Trichome birefringence-like C-terminal domain-containing protein n=1 Tax=Aegilops tauschii TaxID=37682 RepID=M8C235_AEGTA